MSACFAALLIMLAWGLWLDKRYGEDKSVDPPKPAFQTLASILSNCVSVIVGASCALAWLLPIVAGCLEVARRSEF